MLLFTLINSLTLGMAVFLVATGLTLIFGIMRVLNFAHGAFFMFGAYLAASLLGNDPGSIWTLIGAALVSGLAAGALGLAVQHLVLKRLADVDEHFSLIATYALMLMSVGAIKTIWGLEFQMVNPPPELIGGVMIFDTFVPSFSLFIIAAGIVVFVLLELVIFRAWFGKVAIAIARDGWMSNLMGINSTLGINIVVTLAFALAGLAGGLLLPNQTLSPSLGDTFLLLSFITIVIGGLGNIRGAFLAALLISVIDGLNTHFLPEMPGTLIYIGMVLCLLLWPSGLLGESRL